MIELDKSELTAIIDGFKDQIEQLTKIVKRKEFNKKYSNIVESTEKFLAEYANSLENNNESEERMKQMIEDFQRIQRNYNELCQLGEEIERTT